MAKSLNNNRLKLLKCIIKYNFILIVFLSLHTFYLSAQSPSFATYMPLVIPGDKPDPTLTRIGKDFYYSGSSFSLSPIIHHSTDLVHWEAIAQPVSTSWSSYGSKPGSGCWGGNLVFFANKYWYFFARPTTMYFTTAQNIRGPWSTPVKMIGPAQVPTLGQDNSIFIDDDGSVYLVVKNGQPNNWIIQLGNDGQPNGTVLDLRWLNPAPTYPYGWAEGPTMWKYKGYYYYTFAKNAGGGQIVMRNKNLVADQVTWEILGDFYNVGDPKASLSLFRSINHTSQVVMLNDSTSWATVQSYLKSGTSDAWVGAGRQGIMTQIIYDSNGRPVGNYPINEAMTAPRLPSSGIPWMVPHTDYFNSTSLSYEWQTLNYTPNPVYSLTDRLGWVRLFPDNGQNTLLKKDAEHNYSLITKLDFDAKATTYEAGLQVISSGQLIMAKLCSSLNSVGTKVIKFLLDTTGISYEIPNLIGNVVWLKMVRVNHVLTAYYSANGFDWIQVGSSMDVSLLDKQPISSTGWTGNTQGIYTKGGSADFDLYIYRDAYTPILPECPANQFGTTSTLGAEVLDNIHNNDWALYAGVEFGDDSYPTKTISFEVTASSIATSAVIEVWLDSIKTGKKLVDCPISSTGSLTTFKTFTVSMPEQTGMHDIYLRFVGTGTDKLLVLKSFRFVGALKSPSEIQSVLNENGSLKIFPNPASNELTVICDQSFSRIRIFQLDGKVLIDNFFNEPTLQKVLNLSQPKGNYIVEVSGSFGKLTTKLNIL